MSNLYIWVEPRLVAFGPYTRDQKKVYLPGLKAPDTAKYFALSEQEEAGRNWTVVH